MTFSTTDVSVPEADGVEVKDDTLTAELSDGRSISVPAGRSVCGRKAEVSRALACNAHGWKALSLILGPQMYWDQ